MLLYIDQLKVIRIFRMEESEAGVKRVRIGAVQKNKLQIGDELRQALNEEEIAEVDQVIELYAKRDSVQAQLDILRFPEIVRNVVDHLLSGGANELERRVLTTALVDGFRHLRREERKATPDMAAE